MLHVLTFLSSEARSLSLNTKETIVPVRQFCNHVKSGDVPFANSVALRFVLTPFGLTQGHSTRDTVIGSP